MTFPALCNAPGGSPLRYTPHVLYPPATPGTPGGRRCPCEQQAGFRPPPWAKTNRTDSKADMHMSAVTMRELLEAGVHFGHQTRRWNPKMRRYIFGERGGIHIIDLQKTERLLQNAQEFAGQLAGRGGTVLFVGTKKQARDAIREAAEACGMPYVNQRWL